MFLIEVLNIRIIFSFLYWFFTTFVLGFYATGENSSAGNYGLLDQAMAIEWVYDNIDAFNGDRERITLFGPGVGAASAGIHALSNRLGSKSLDMLK